MSGSWLYQLQDVQKEYEGRPVLRVARLEVFTGEVLCLVGPTGAGKSTLLRLLSALEPPTAGRLAFGEYQLGGQALPLAAQRRVTMVFQRPLPLAGSVQANVEYGLRLRGVGRSSPKVQEVMERLGLTKLATQQARTLSGGQWQLVALARALVLEPQVLLLDEPTANLDPAHVALVEETLGEFHHQRRATIVWATHNLFQARRMAQRVALLLDGEVVEVAPPTTFFDAPQDARTAAFVQGRMVY